MIPRASRRVRSGLASEEPIDAIVSSSRPSSIANGLPTGLTELGSRALTVGALGEIFCGEGNRNLCIGRPSDRYITGQFSAIKEKFGAIAQDAMTTIKSGSKAFSAAVRPTTIPIRLNTESRNENLPYIATNIPLLF